MREAMEPIDGLCGLSAPIGRDERCPGAVWGFWEEPVGCVLHGVTPHLRGREELAWHLDELRSRLDEVRGSSTGGSVFPRNEIQRGR